MHTRDAFTRLLLCLPCLPLLAGCAIDEPLATSAPPPLALAVDPRTRTYYIAADEVVWDYAPSGINQITGLPFEGEALTFTQRTNTTIGTTYKKALYREYTNASFTTLKPVDAKWAHLGFMGPVIRAVVDDTVKIVFKNNTSFKASMHPHGFFYLRSSEGAPYDDGSGSIQPGAIVPPGGTYTYEWIALERSGPGPADGSSVAWMYHSHVDEVRDVYAGLMGPIIVTARNKAREDGSPVDIDREFITMFEVVDENNSHFIDDNIATYAFKPNQVRPEAEEFVESNLKHAINGYLYGNLPLAALTMARGAKVRWYLIGMGTEVDLHTAHFHGVTVLNLGARTDVVELLPASMKAVDLVADNPGTWLFHCHVNDHIVAGMAARFRITS